MLMMAVTLLPRNVSIGQAAGRDDPPKQLRNATSAFLRRAAEQSLDWYPLAPEPLAKAKETNKALFVESGAIWCPFCEELDGDPNVANFFNQHFVAVRIDYDAEPELAHTIGHPLNWEP